MRRYRGRHLKRPPVKRGPAVFGAATAMWMAGTAAAHAGTHVVRPGETLSGIARRYGTTTAQLAAANDLGDPDFIISGQRLRVPGAATSGGSHTVRPGETLSGIASRYGTSVTALARTNKLPDPSFIVAGTELRVPGGVAPATAAAAGSHTVTAGENLSEIAARYGTSVAALAAINNLPDPSLIVAGLTLRVPAATAPGAPTDIESTLEAEAVAQGVEPALVKAVAWQESGWQQGVRSSAGAIGVMQVMPGTARFVNRVLGAGDRNVKAAPDNVHLGVRYLRLMLDTMPNERKALAAYYAGPRAVGRALNKDQRHYVDAVLAHRERFR